MSEQTTGQETEYEPEDSSEAGPGHDVPTDELRRAINARRAPRVAQEAAAEPEPLVDEPAEEEPAGEPEIIQPDQPEQAPPSPAAPPEDAEIINLRLDEAQRRAEHFESLVGREAGRMGFLEQQNRKLAEQLANLERALRGNGADRDDPLQDTGGDRRQPAPEPRDSNAMFMSGEAVRQALTSFMDSQGIKIEQKDGQTLLSDPEFSRELSGRAQELAQWAGSGDAMAASAQTNLIVREAWSKAQADRAVRLRREAQERRSTQNEQLRKAKMAQASAGQSTKATPPRKTFTSPSQLATKDLRELINSRAGLDS